MENLKLEGRFSERNKAPVKKSEPDIASLSLLDYIMSENRQKLGRLV